MSPAAVVRCLQGSECGGCPTLCQRSVCRKGTGSSPCIVPQSVGTRVLERTWPFLHASPLSLMDSAGVGDVEPEASFASGHCGRIPMACSDRWPSGSTCQCRALCGLGPPCTAVLGGLGLVCSSPGSPSTLLAQAYGSYHAAPGHLPQDRVGDAFPRLWPELASSSAIRLEWWPELEEGGLGAGLKSWWQPEPVAALSMPACPPAWRRPACTLAADPQVIVRPWLHPDCSWLSVPCTCGSSSAGCWAPHPLPRLPDT